MFLTKKAKQAKGVKPGKWKRVKMTPLTPTAPVMPNEDYTYPATKRLVKRIGKQTIILTQKGLDQAAKTGFHLCSKALSAMRGHKEVYHARLVIGNHRKIADLKMKIELKKKPFAKSK